MNNELQETYKEVQYENEEEVFYECISDDEIVRYKTLTDAREARDMHPNQDWVIRQIILTKRIIEP
tara:strand:+ start:3585 stop:3782 length:198 start_codon:yes stop_codon:yes gene_type:complete